jgi:hypothetical protein
VRASVRLTPRARAARIDGVEGGLLKVAVTAPAAENQANEALLRLLAKVAPAAYQLIDRRGCQEPQQDRAHRRGAGGLDDAARRASEFLLDLSLPQGLTRGSINSFNLFVDGRVKPGQGE